MEKFIGRKNELDALEKLYNTPGFQMTVIYGRRRIGKSTLIKEFIKEKKAVFFTAIRAGIHRNLELLGKQALEVLAPAVGALAFEKSPLRQKDIPDQTGTISVSGCRGICTRLFQRRTGYLLWRDRRRGKISLPFR